jgi:hypothetical protein
MRFLMNKHIHQGEHSQAKEKRMDIVSKLKSKVDKHTLTPWWTGNKYEEWRAKKRLTVGTKYVNAGSDSHPEGSMQKY